ncbi:uncharacterized protein LAJ45_09091 [Morchella importuna]|uniref:uncharacterized protein n=1 Tax=Morchella importuna TaxID=1174673 RepID=UPI001E8E090F|nr:uncharacterized protein LAJ45_09091 [Morchella importuna]KAH8146717.1 hypothetical protein LAJ45_09091 [Morchella importuna]
MATGISVLVLSCSVICYSCEYDVCVYGTESNPNRVETSLSQIPSWSKICAAQRFFEGGVVAWLLNNLSHIHLTADVDW